MAEPSREKQFEEVAAKFTEPADREVIATNRQAFIDSKNLSDLAFLPGGVALIKSLRDDFTKSLNLLIETRQGRYLSDVESNLNLLTKISSAKNQTEAIGQWLDSLS